MTVEEFQSATADQLREKANDCFARAARTGSGDWAGLYMEAQFYLAEIERRESAKIAKRDYTLEVWVIVLIGVEIVLSLLALGTGYIEGAKQITSLDSLNQSTAMTAGNTSKLT